MLNKLKERVDYLNGMWVSVLRGGRGTVVWHPGVRDTLGLQPLEVYEFEGCPYCRKLREVLTELDLNYLSRPSARGSHNRDRLAARTGKVQFPYLVDPNTGRELFESETIISYLYETYGRPRHRLARFAAPLNTALGGVASVQRPLARKVQGAYGDREALEPVVVYGFESSPFCRRVREALNRLDLNAEIRNVGKRSLRRPELVARGGKMQVPYLIDPNTGVEMYESMEIVAYLERTYG